MTISPPNIVGPLTPVSVGMRVANVLVGGVVRAMRGGVEIGSHAAVASDMSFPFHAGVQLHPHEKISAIQEFEGVTSAEAPQPTVVQDIAPPYSGHRFLSHVYGCSTSLFIGGVISGAELRLTSSGKALGASQSIDGTVVVDLVSPVKAGQRVEAQQVVAGVAGPIVSSIPADPAPPIGGQRAGIQLRFSDAMECMTSLEVFNLVDGEVLIVNPDLDNKPDTSWQHKAPVSQTRLWFPPLQSGQRIGIKEQLCEPGEDQKGREITVSPLEFSQLPTIAGPLCTGTRRLLVTGLVPQARVRIIQNGVVVGTGQATSDVLDIVVDPLVSGEVVAIEELCSKSCTGLPEQVVDRLAEPDACVLTTPLYDCSMRVWFTGAEPGSWVACFSHQVGQLSDWMRVPAGEGYVDLHTPLKESHDVFLRQSVCGADPRDSQNTETVKALGEYLPAPTVRTPVFVDQPVIYVDGAVPGANVQLYTRSGHVENSIADSQGTASFHHKVTISANLYAPSTYLQARQVLCDKVSRMSSDVELQVRQPKSPTILEPKIGAVGVDLSLTLRWSDPGAGTKDAATGFLVIVTDATNPKVDEYLAWIVKEVTDKTQLAIPAGKLGFATTFYWSVLGVVGEPGFEVRGPTSFGHFTTVSQPTQQGGGQQGAEAITGNSQVHVYNCNNTRRAVSIHVRDITSGTPFKEVANLNAQYDDGGYCPAFGTAPHTISLTDKHLYEVVAVDAGNDNCSDASPETLGCRRRSQVFLGNAKGGPGEFAVW